MVSVSSPYILFAASEVNGNYARRNGLLCQRSASYSLKPCASSKRIFQVSDTDNVQGPFLIVIHSKGGSIHLDRESDAPNQPGEAKQCHGQYQAFRDAQQLLHRRPPSRKEAHKPITQGQTSKPSHQAMSELSAIAQMLLPGPCSVVLLRKRPSPSL